MAAVPSTELSAHEAARRELGSRLRALRKDAQLTGPQLAELAGVSQAGLSRLENGRFAPKLDDVELIARALKAPKNVEVELKGLASDIRADLVNWRLAHRAGIDRSQDEFGGLEQKAKEIRIFHLAVIPGLIQTPSYARAVLSAVTGQAPETLDDAVDARMRRQEILYDARKTFRFVFMESVLHGGVASKDVMAEQIDRLLTASAIRQVSLGVIPLGTVTPVLAPNGFVIHDDRVVFTETLTAELTLNSPRDVSAYLNAFAEMEQIAVKGKDLRKLLGARLEV